MHEEISHGVFIATALPQRCREEQQLGLVNSEYSVISFVEAKNVDLNDFCVRLLKGNDQSFAFCGRSGSLYHGHNDIDSWTASVEQS
jgi:hypothetical protein